ncbi:MAG: tetratricopeptide repeat protein [Candidatus Thorarchaeota archaeon]
MTDKNANIVFFEARALEKEGKLEEALQKYEEAITIDDTVDKAWIYKSRIHSQLGQIAEATQCAKRAIELEPKWAKIINKGEKKIPIEQDDIIPLEHDITPSHFFFALHFLNLKPSEDNFNNLSREFNTKLDGKMHFPTLAIAFLTRKIIDLGPQRIIDSETKEEWVIERKGDEIITHEHIEPIRKPQRGTLTIGSLTLDFNLYLMRLLLALKLHNDSSNHQDDLIKRFTFLDLDP